MAQTSDTVDYRVATLDDETDILAVLEEVGSGNTGIARYTRQKRQDLYYNCTMPEEREVMGRS
jgi:hypothetical protein